MKKIVQRRVREEFKLYCDKCGKECETKIPTEGAHELSWSTGYGSKYDEYVFKLDLCDNCFEKIAKSIFNN